jgi:hypothetical protein
LEQPIASAIRAESKETGAVWEEIAAQREAAFGNPTEAKQQGLKLYPSSQAVEVEAALAFAMSGDAAKAELPGRRKADFLDEGAVALVRVEKVKGGIALDVEQARIAALKSLFQQLECFLFLF